MKQDSYLLPGSFERPIAIDLSYDPAQEQKGLVIFVHGFKGFKDWGTHHLVARFFAERGIPFLKFNFSHNGTTPEQPLEFADLEAFGQNTVSMEINELRKVIDFALSGQAFPKPKKIHLIGHSKGGGVAILEAAGNPNVSSLITWASTMQFSALWPKDEEEAWRSEGVRYVFNSRTKQRMPQYKVILEDVEEHQQAFDILAHAKQIQQPWLIVHGTADTAVSYRKAETLKFANPSAELFLVEQADHVFGGRHPYTSERLPEDLRKVCERCLRFIDEQEAHDSSQANNKL